MSHSVVGLAESRTAAEPEAPPRGAASRQPGLFLNRTAGAGDTRRRFVLVQAAGSLEADAAGGSSLAYLNRMEASSAQGPQRLR